MKNCSVDEWIDTLKDAKATGMQHEKKIDSYYLECNNNKWRQIRHFPFRTVFRRDESTAVMKLESMCHNMSE